MEENNKAPSFIGMAEDECEQHLSATYEYINRFNRRLKEISNEIEQIKEYLQGGNKEKANEIITSGEFSMSLIGFPSIVKDLEKSAACAAATHHVLFRAKQELFLKS